MESAAKPAEAKTEGEFNHEFTVFPDDITWLHHYPCDQKWPIGYHPSLDVLNERARGHQCTARQT